MARTLKWCFVHCVNKCLNMEPMTRIVEWSDNTIWSVSSQLSSYISGRCLFQLMALLPRANRKIYTIFSVLVIIVLFTFLGVPSITVELVYEAPAAPAATYSSSRDAAGSGIGRTAGDGGWYQMPGEKELYLYTAFYDDRVSLGSLPVIRIIAVGEEDMPILHCTVEYEHNGDGETGVRYNYVDVISIGAGAYRHNKIFHEYVLGCLLKSEHRAVAVGLTMESAGEPVFMIPVEGPVKSASPWVGIVACVSVSYWQIEPYKIVEWMEIQRLLGIDKVVVYNNSVAPAAARVFRHYNKTDFMDLRQSHNFLSDSGEPTFHLHMSPVINDCMYRYMYRYKHIVVIDFDEVIVPRQNATTLREMLQLAELREPQYHPARSYVFRNAYFFLNRKADPSQHPHLRSMKYRVRQPVSPPGYSAKSIIDPTSCHAMHNHYCWGVNKLYENGAHMVFVSDELALLHHYKRCHIDNYEATSGECQKQLEQEGEHDNTMLKYREKLTHAVDEQLRLIGM